VALRFAVYNVLLPAIAVLLLLFAATALGPSLRAARGEGLPGTFTAARQDCGPRGGCDVMGTFVSDDGTVRFTDAYLDGSADRHGRQVKALYLGQDDPPTVHEPGTSQWVLILAFLLGSGGYFLWRGTRLIRRSGARTPGHRTPSRPPTDAAPLRGPAS
jgi:hypothetical protein